MGIPKFFRWLSERYPLINISVGEGDLKIPEMGTLLVIVVVLLYIENIE